MRKFENIFLIGFMGCGKSSVAAKLHELYQLEVVEMDEVIAQRENRSIPEIFEQSGEAYFRQVETELISELRNASGKVVSCGGGVVLREENVRMMKESGRIVLLTASPKTILERVQADESRPILKGKKTVTDIEMLMVRRKTSYEAAADFVINTENKDVTEICDEVKGKLEEAGN